MDPRFECTAGEAEIVQALQLWPELNGLQVRPLLVTTFGDIFLDVQGQGVWAASPLRLAWERVAASVEEFSTLFNDRDWAEARLLVSLVMDLDARGLTRPPDQVFAVAPHPALGGQLDQARYIPMSLRLWHDIARQVREQLPAAAPAKAPPTRDRGRLGWLRRGN